MDLSSQASIEQCCSELGAQLTQIDLLVNNAGLMTGGLLEEQAIDEVYAMFQVNLVGVTHLTQRVLPGMLARRKGTIANNASISGYAHFPAASTYAASKAGIVGFTESLRRELRGTGVHAMHLVTPGVATDMLSATDEVYGRYMDTSGWDRIPPEEWADQGRARDRSRPARARSWRSLRLGDARGTGTRVRARRDNRPLVQPTIT